MDVAGCSAPGRVMPCYLHHSKAGAAAGVDGMRWADRGCRSGALAAWYSLCGGILRDMHSFAVIRGGIISVRHSEAVLFDLA